MCTPDREIGITLIESIIILVIISILSLLAIPLLSATLQKHRVINAAEGLYSFLQVARSEAVKRNTKIYVAFTTGDNWCYGMNAGSTCNCNIAGNCALGTISVAHSGQNTLSTTGLANNFLYFEGTHGAASTSGTMTFTIDNDTAYIKISVGRLGSVKICASDISGYQGC